MYNYPRLDNRPKNMDYDKMENRPQNEELSPFDKQMDIISKMMQLNEERRTQDRLQNKRNLGSQLSNLGQSFESYAPTAAEISAKVLPENPRLQKANTLEGALTGMAMALNPDRAMAGVQSQLGEAAKDMRDYQAKMQEFNLKADLQKQEAQRQEKEIQNKFDLQKTLMDYDHTRKLEEIKEKYENMRVMARDKREFDLLEKAEQKEREGLITDREIKLQNMKNENAITVEKIRQGKSDLENEIKRMKEEREKAEKEREFGLKEKEFGLKERELEVLKGKTTTQQELDRLEQERKRAKDREDKLQAEQKLGIDREKLEIDRAKTKKEAETAKRLPPATILQLEAGANLPTRLDALEKEMDKRKEDFGFIKGRAKSLNPYDTEAQVFNANLKEMAQTIGSYLEGGVLRKEDIPKYEAMLPKLSDSYDVAKGKLTHIRDMLKKKQDSIVQSFEIQGYDVGGVKKTKSTNDEFNEIIKKQFGR